MTFARVRLVVAVALFVGWLGWLGYGVSQRNRAVVLSRAQLTAATHLLVADVAVGEDGLPLPTVTITQVLRGDGPATGARAEVLNLPKALPPGAAGFPGPGRYFLPVVGDGKTFAVARLPASPGYASAEAARPAVYPWNGNTEAQLRGLGVLP